MKELTDLDVGRVPLCVEDILHEVVALQVSFVRWNRQYFPDSESTILMRMQP